MQKMMMVKDEKTGKYKFELMPAMTLPLCEGKCPPVVDENGKSYYPEPSNEPDPEIKETEKYAIMDKEEYWNYVTRCKSCKTTFIAYKNNCELVRNFCPNCGKDLQ